MVKAAYKQGSLGVGYVISGRGTGKAKTAGQ